MPLQTLRHRYEVDLASELARQHPHPARIIEEHDLARLPEPVRRFVRQCGLLGRSHASNARVIWSELDLRSAHDASWMRTECEQVSFFREPARLALMRSVLARCIPFDGYDRYRDGHGEMAIHALGWLPVRRAQGRHMDASALVTYLSEALLVPSLLLETNLSWTCLDGRSARAELHHAGLRVAGVFIFDHVAETARFETMDRWRDGRVPQQQRWSAEVSAFEVHKGLRLATRATATWHSAEGPLTYMRGAIESVTLDFHDARAKVHPPWHTLGFALPKSALSSLPGEAGARLADHEVRAVEPMRAGD